MSRVLLSFIQAFYKLFPDPTFFVLLNTDFLNSISKSFVYGPPLTVHYSVDLSAQDD